MAPDQHSAPPEQPGSPDLAELIKVLEYLPLGAWVWDPHGRLLWVNREQTRLTGYTAADIPTVLDWFARAYPEPETRKRVINSWAGHLERGGGTQVVFPVTRADGAVRSLRFWGCFLPNGNSMVLAEDTDQSRASHLNRYRAVFNHLTSGVALYQAVDGGRDFVFLEMNAAGGQICHRDPQALVGMSVRQAFPGVERMGLLEVMRQVWRDGRPRSHPISEYQDQEIQAWFENHVFRLPTGELAALFSDLTDQKRIERKIATSEARFRILYRQTPAMLHSIDEQGRLVEVSDYWLEQLGYQRHEVLGRRSIDFLTPESRRFAQESLLPAFFRDGYSHQVPVQVVTKDGRVRDMLLSSTSERDADGRVIRSLSVTVDVTEINRDRALLTESEQRLSLAVRGGLVGFWDWLVDRNQVLYSRRWAEILGEDHDRLPQEYSVWESRLHPHDREATLANLRLHLEGQAPVFQSEHRLRHADGRWIWVLGMGRVGQRDAQGRPSRVTGIMLDINQRKEAETDLKLRLEELTTLHSVSQRINADLNLEHMVQHALTEVCQALSPDMTLIYLRKNERLVLMGVQGPGSLPTPSPTLSSRPGECLCGKAVELGQPVYSLDLASDVRCSRSECREAGMVSYASLPLVIEDRVIGVLGLGSRTRRDFAGRDQFLRLLAAQLASGFSNAVLHQELSRYAGDLEDRVRARTAQLEEANQRLSAEVAQRQAAQKQLEAARDEAESANRAKSEFLAKMSHEIRTPMNAVINMSELVLLGHLEPEQRQHLQTVQRSARHLLTVINDILDISKVEAGRLQLEALDFDLTEILRSTLASLSQQATAKGLFLHLDTADDFRRWVKGDPVRLQQVLINLVGNGLKFTRRGGITLRVRCDQDSCGQPEDTSPDAPPLWLHFEIADTGIGIRPEQRELIFEPFQQEDDSITRRYGGTGLGLPISRQLVELMGGRMWVDSNPQGGSTFHFTVRLAPGKPNSPPTPMFSLLRGQRGLEILLAEDNSDNIKVATTLLEKLGHRVQVARDGRQALEALRQRAYDLVIMDLEMPEMDGLEATQRIRRGEAGTVNQDVRIVALTAHALTGYRERCLAAGMNHYLSKPFSLAELAALVGNASGWELEAPETATPPAAPPLGAPPRWNRADALIRFGGDQELYRDICLEFLSDYRQRAGRLIELAQKGQLAELALHAHALKGNCGTIGAEACQHIASELEQCARREETEPLGDLVRLLEEELAAVAALLAE